MEVVKTTKELNNQIDNAKLSALTIGFVPTMGALHEGHLSLIKAAKLSSDYVVCSIFVNPTQFNNPEDLEKYPRDIDADLTKLEAIECDLVYTPDYEDVYAQKPITKFSFGFLETIMEGANRPGHFNGVGLVVSKLFNKVNPDIAFFGRKDLQQSVIIEQMVKDLNFPIDIQVIDTVREESGLAMSSRNLRLSENNRIKASKIYEQLCLAEKEVRSGTDHEAVQTNSFKELSSIGEVEYFEIVDRWTLGKPDNSKDLAICTAVEVAGVRLIDNIVFNLR